MCAVYCVQCAVCCVLCAVCCVLCAVCSVLCTVCSVLCAVCSVQCAMCCVLCAVCSVQCAVCCPTHDQLQFLNTVAVNKVFTLCSVAPLHHICYAVLLQIFRWRRATSDFLEVHMLSSPDLRRGSAAARLSGLRVWTRREHLCLSLVIVLCCQAQVSATCRSLVQRIPTECCVLSGRRLCDGPIPRTEESYRLWCVWV